MSSLHSYTFFHDAPCCGLCVHSLHPFDFDQHRHPTMYTFSCNATVFASYHSIPFHSIPPNKHTPRFRIQRLFFAFWLRPKQALASLEGAPLENFAPAHAFASLEIARLALFAQQRRLKGPFDEPNGHSFKERNGTVQK